MAVLGENRYGKTGIRLATVTRDGQQHAFRDLTIDIALEGDFAAAHSDGDNAHVLPTDTMRNTVYDFAAEGPIGPPERFGLRLARHFVETVPPVAAAIVSLAEDRWQRIADHPHAFTRAAGGQRTAIVSAAAAGVADVVAGIDGLDVCKTARSGFAGFLRDDYTTLAETDDRVLATTVTAHWRYTDADVDFDAAAGSVHRLLLATFADHDSRSVQHTLHAMGAAVLDAHAEIAEIRLRLPNRHHIAVQPDVPQRRRAGLPQRRRAGLPQRRRAGTYVVTDRPSGLIEATLTRDDST